MDASEQRLDSVAEGTITYTAAKFPAAAKILIRHATVLAGRTCLRHCIRSAAVTKHIFQKVMNRYLRVQREPQIAILFRTVIAQVLIYLLIIGNLRNMHRYCILFAIIA